MKLEITYDDGLFEEYDTSSLTASAPRGGGVCMVEMMPRYYEEDAMAPYGENNRLEAGLWVHIYQFDAVRVGEANSAAASLMTRVSIASKEQMDHVLLVKRDGAIWLARDWKTKKLIDFGKLNAFGMPFVHEWAKCSMYNNVINAQDVAEATGLLGPGGEVREFAELFSLPESFVNDAFSAGFAPMTADDEDYDDDIE